MNAQLNCQGKQTQVNNSILVLKFIMLVGSGNDQCTIVLLGACMAIDITFDDGTCTCHVHVGTEVR